MEKKKGGLFERCRQPFWPWWWKSIAAGELRRSPIEGCFVEWLHNLLNDFSSFVTELFFQILILHKTLSAQIKFKCSALSYLKSKTKRWSGEGAAKHNVYCSHFAPVAPGLIIGVTKNFSIGVAEIYQRHCLEQWTEAWCCHLNQSSLQQVLQKSLCGFFFQNFSRVSRFPSRIRMSSSFLRVQEKKTFCCKKPGDDKFMFKDILGVIVVVGKASNWFGQLLMSFLVRWKLIGVCSQLIHWAFKIFVFVCK